MIKAQIDFAQHTEREILMNVLPRLESVEDDIERQDRRQDDLDKAISALRKDLVDTESRLSKKVDDRFDKVDQHLSAQDERLDNIVGEKRRWPDTAVVITTIAGTVIVGLIVTWATHTLHW